MFLELSASSHLPTHLAFRLFLIWSLTHLEHSVLFPHLFDSTCPPSLSRQEALVAQIVPGLSNWVSNGRRGAVYDGIFFSSASSLLPRQQCKSTEPSLILKRTRIMVKMVPIGPLLSPFTDSCSQTPTRLSHRRWAPNK